MAESIAHAAATTGIGLTLLPSFYAHAGFGGQPPAPGQRRFICNIESFTRLIERSRTAIAGLPGANLGLAPHSLRAVAPDELDAVVTLAGDGPIHIHAAEQVKEVEDCLAWSGKRPVEWLLDRYPVDDRWCLVHATHMTDGETAKLAASRAVAGLCPITEANLGDGIFKGAELVAAQGIYGTGTDSNVRITLAGELCQLEYAQRLGRRLRNVMPTTEGASTGASLFSAALGGGARALQVPNAGLAEGAWADVVTLDASHPALAHLSGDALIDGWIFATADRVVDTVWSLGRKVVTSGRHISRTPIARRYAATLAKVMAA
jgi:formiminoglutamate deiminase